MDDLGNVYLAYYHEVQQPPNALIDVYIATSIDDGASFLPNDLRVTSASSNPEVALWSHDYCGITATAAKAFPLWTDYRNGNPDIYFAEVDYTESGTITASKTWTQYVHVTDDVTVNAGVTLTVNPGVAVEFAANPNDPSALTVLGNLQCEGTAEKEIVYQADAPGTGQWFGIRCENGSTDMLKYCTIGQAREGVRVENWTGDVDIENCDISSNENYGVHIVRSVGSMVNGNHLTNNPIGVLVQNYSNQNCDLVTVSSNLIEGNLLGTVLDKAIYVEAMNKWGGVVTIENNTVMGDASPAFSYGIGAKAVQNLVLPHPNTIPFVAIRGNPISKCSQIGIGVENYLSEIIDNELFMDLCSFGMRVYRGDPNFWDTDAYVRQNGIYDAETVAVWTNTAEADLGTDLDWGNNCVWGSAGYHVKYVVAGGPPVYAQHNWWHPLESERFFGNVLWDHYNQPPCSGE